MSLLNVGVIGYLEFVSQNRFGLVTRRVIGSVFADYSLLGKLSIASSVAKAVRFAKSGSAQVVHL
jgi:ABC-type ATPase involved in cell division